MKQETLRNFLNKKNVFAVIGVSRNPEKYGFQVYDELLSAGYEVYPINPNAEKILGNKCYSDVEKLPKIPDVVVFVTLPMITFKIIKKILKLGIKNVWMQPGSESKDAIDFCKKNNLNLIYNMCVMIESQKK